MSDVHSAHHANYFAIFLFLCTLTAASVVADIIEINNYLVLIVIVLAIATAKALFVMMFFMHLKFEGKWKFVLLAPTVVLAAGLPIALMPDIGAHYYLVDTPQQEAFAEQPDHSSVEHPTEAEHH